MFVLWAIAPFAMLILRSRRERTFAVVIAGALLAGYGYAAFGPPLMHGAFLYLLLPGLAWLAIVGRLAARRP